jgi:hypothetical protein
LKIIIKKLPPNIILNVMTEWMALQLRIWEVLGSTLGLESSCLD